jgi:hypothetical protein
VSLSDAATLYSNDAPRLVYEVVVQPTLGAERILGRLFRDPCPQGRSRGSGHRAVWYRFQDGSRAGETRFGASPVQLREAMGYLVMAVRCLCANRLSVPDPVAAQHLEGYGALPASLAPVRSTWVDDVIVADPPCPTQYQAGEAFLPDPLRPSVTLAPHLVRLPKRYPPVLHVPRMSNAVARMRALQNKVFTCTVVETLPDGHALVYWYAYGAGGATRIRSPMLQGQARKALQIANLPLPAELELTPVALPQYHPPTLSPFEQWHFAWPMGAWLTRALQFEDGPDGVLLWHSANRYIDNVERFAVPGDALHLTEHVKRLVEQAREDELPDWALERADKVYARQIQAYEEMLGAVPGVKALLR